MRSATAIIISMCLVGSALARVGETEQQIRNRYGKGTPDSGPLLPPGVSSSLTKVDAEVFQKDGVVIVAVFFRDASTNRVVGEIIYNLPDTIKASPEAERNAAMKLLDANAAGKAWEPAGASPSNRVKYFKRSEARAEYCTGLGIVVVTLDTFAAYVEKTRRAEVEAATNKAERLQGF